eukprot:scaffold163958_cov29-Prasinocladus_malaysianus.AAC.1
MGAMEQVSYAIAEAAEAAVEDKGTKRKADGVSARARSFLLRSSSQQMPAWVVAVHKIITKIITWQENPIIIFEAVATNMTLGV